MAVAIVNQWVSTAGDADDEISITPADGNWLICSVAYRVIDGSAPKISVGDLRRNLWTVGKAIQHPTAGIGVQVWVCPVVKTYGGTTKVYVAAAGIGASDTGSVPVNITEVSGVTGGLDFDAAVFNTANAASGITLTAPAPVGSVNCLMAAAAVADTNFASVNTTGSGWSALTLKADTNPNVGLAAAWREATTGGSVTIALPAGTANWAGVAVSIQTAGALPAVTPDWGAVSVEAQLALGYEPSTPVSAMRWRTLSTRCQSIQTERGISAELGTVEAGDNTFGWINDDGAFTPRPAGTGTVVAAGTTSTAPIFDPDAAGFVVGDFFRLQTYLGALREDTVFQITAMPSTNGVTTVSFTPSAAAAPAVGDQLVGVPIDAFVPVRTVATVDGKTYPVMVGTAESLPQTWLDGTHGRVNMTAVDAYATLTATVLPSVEGATRRPIPVEYWKLDDPQGAGQAANSATDSTTVLTQRTSKFGSGTNGAADFGASTQDVQFGAGPGQTDSLFGSAASGWGQSGLATGDTTKGFALVAESDDFPPISGGVTILGISCLFSSQPTGDGTVFVIRNRDPSGGGGAGAIIKLALDSSAQAVIVVWDKDTHVSTRTLTSPIIGNSGFLPWAVTFTRTNWTVYVGGSSFTQSGTCDLVDAWNVIDIGGEADAIFNGHCLNGVHAHVAIYDRVLSAGEVNGIHFAASIGMAAQTTIDGTIRRMLTLADWPGARVLCSTDITTSEDVGLEGGALGEVVAGIATWEDGLLAIDAAGYLRYVSRDVLDRATSKFTLGPNTGGGEIPYLGAPAYDVDGKLLFTEIDVQNTARFASYPTGTTIDGTGTYTAIAPTYATKGPRPRPWQAHLFRIENAFHLAWWLAARYGSVQLRIRAVQVDPRAASGTTGWHAVLGAEVGDVMTVNWQPGAAPAIDMRCVILGIKHEATPSRWVTTFVLMEASDPGIVLDDSTAGVVSSGTLTL